MGVSGDDVYNAPAVVRRQARQASWHKFTPLVRCFCGGGEGGGGSRWAGHVGCQRVSAQLSRHATALPPPLQVWAPFLYTLRFALKGRVQPQTQHKVFIGATLVALAHAGFVMTSDSTMGAGT